MEVDEYSVVSSELDHPEVRFVGSLSVIFTSTYLLFIAFTDCSIQGVVVIASTPDVALQLTATLVLRNGAATRGAMNAPIPKATCKACRYGPLSLPHIRRQITLPPRERVEE